jgi:hypothetical protein
MVHIEQCVIEAEHWNSHAEGFERFEEFFGGAGLESLGRLFEKPGRSEFHEHMQSIIDEVASISQLQLEQLVEDFPSEATNSHFFSESERGAFWRLIEGLMSPSRSQQGISEALHALRRAALKANPAPALVLEPQAFRREHDRGESLPLGTGEQAYRVTDSYIIGVLAINGSPPREKPIDRDSLPSYCGKLKAAKSDNGRVMLGSTGTLWIKGNQITLLAVGEPAFRSLNKLSESSVSILETFERIVCSDNILEGPGSCLIGQQIIFGGNTLSRLAYWVGADEGHGFIYNAAGNVSQPFSGPSNFIAAAVVIANDPVIQGNQGSHPLSLETNTSEYNMLGASINPNDFVLVVTPPRPKAEDFLRTPPMQPMLQLLADNLQNASLIVWRECESNPDRPTGS